MMHTVYLDHPSNYSADLLSQLLDKIHYAFNSVVVWHSDYTDAVDALFSKYGLRCIGLFGCPNHHDDWFSWTAHLGILDADIRRLAPYSNVSGFMLGTEINWNAFVRNLDTQLSMDEYVAWLKRTSEIARGISAKPIYSDVVYLPNVSTPPPPSDAELRAYGLYRNGIFWSVGHTLANSRPEHVLYRQLKSISGDYGFQCLARTGGYNIQCQWFPNWIREIYANGADGLTLWRWESLYSADAITGTFSTSTYAGLMKVFNEVQTRGRNLLIGAAGLLALAGLAVWKRKPLVKLLKKLF